MPRMRSTARLVPLGPRTDALRHMKADDGDDVILPVFLDGELYLIPRCRCFQTRLVLTTARALGMRVTTGAQSEAAFASLRLLGTWGAPAGLVGCKVGCEQGLV